MIYSYFSLELIITKKSTKQCILKILAEQCRSLANKIQHKTHKIEHVETITDDFVEAVATKSEKGQFQLSLEQYLFILMNIISSPRRLKNFFDGFQNHIFSRIVEKFNEMVNH